MARLIVIVEGATEESFISNVLAPELWQHNVYASAIIVGRPGHRGGRVNYARYSGDVLKMLKQDSSAYCSTMVDFYRLGDGFPGHPPPAGIANIDKARRVEAAILADTVRQIPDFRPDVRFIPYIQLHEYEGLLFSEPQVFADAINKPTMSTAFQGIRDGFDTPEHIDEGPATAPSKRIQSVCSYSKVIDGTKAAQAVGIARMAAECPHFEEWVGRLRTLV